MMLPVRHAATCIVCEDTSAPCPTALSIYPVAHFRPAAALTLCIYRVAHKKRPELCVTITGYILYEEKFLFAHL